MLTQQEHNNMVIIGADFPMRKNRQLSSKFTIYDSSYSPQLLNICFIMTYKLLTNMNWTTLKCKSKHFVLKICTLPRNASTWPAKPLMALRKMSGREARQGCWQGSITFSLVIANWRNFWVCEITAGLHRFAGFPRQWRNRNQLCAMQSLVIPAGISCASSSAVSQSSCASVITFTNVRVSTSD
jgi:hypothetical protein